MSNQTEHGPTPPTKRGNSPTMNRIAALLAVAVIAGAGAYIYDYQQRYWARPKPAKTTDPMGLGGIGRDPPWDKWNAAGLPDPPPFGVGKDSIPAIDDPVFVEPGDPRLAKQDVDADSDVIGYEHGGEAKAYPTIVLRRHELANDTIGGLPVTVGF